MRLDGLAKRERVVLGLALFVILIFAIIAITGGYMIFVSRGTPLLDRLSTSVMGTIGIFLFLIDVAICFIVFFGFFFGLFDETVTPEMEKFYGDNIDVIL